MVKSRRNQLLMSDTVGCSDFCVSSHGCEMLGQVGIGRKCDASEDDGRGQDQGRTFCAAELHTVLHDAQRLGLRRWEEWSVLKPWPKPPFAGPNGSAASLIVAGSRIKAELAGMPPRKR
jgi:hypothetical protein